MRSRLKSISVAEALLLPQASALLFLAGALLGLSLSVPVVAVAQTSQDATAEKKAEADRLFRQGDYQVQDRKIEAAIQSYKKALEIYQEIKDSWGQVTVLRFLGETYSGRNFEIGIKYVQQSLILARKVRDDYSESQALLALSDINAGRVKYAEAVKYAQQAWRVAQQIENPNNRYLAQSSILTGLIQLYYQLGNEAKTNEYRAIAQKLARQNNSILMQNDQNGEIDKLIFTASNYEMRGEYIKAISYYEKVVILAPKSSYPLREVVYLGTIGRIYLDKLNNPIKAIKYYEQQIAAKQKIPGHLYRSAGLLELGYAYAALGNSAKAFEYFNQLLTSARENGDRSDEFIALSVLAEKYFQTGNYSKAIKYYQQKISFAYEGKDDSSIMYSFFDLGAVYRAAHNHPEAIKTYQQALSIAQEKRDRRHETLALEKIGELYGQQNQPELAIVFYKQAVNIVETIRQELQSLTVEERKKYTESVSSTYRNLANLLLSNSRILEAQQVLELLKVQELKDFDHATRAKIDNGKIALDPTEQAVVNKYGSFIAFGQQLRECQTSKPQCADYDRLIQLRRDAEIEYDQTVKSFETAIKTRKQEDESSFLNPKNDLSREAQKIVESQPNTALIYSLVTDNKLWLVLATKGDVLRQFEVKVSQAELNGTVIKFRQLMEHCERHTCNASDTATLNAVSQQLYNWLFPKPLQQELQGKTPADKIKNLVFAQDRITRYIPMSALFDGKQYLIENYAVSTIVSAKFTNTDRPTYTPQTASVLAAGLSNAVKPDFPPLSNVPLELAAIVQTGNPAYGIYPGLQLLNQQFDFLSLQKNIYGHNILHIATHGAFVRDQPDASYILLGTGKKLPIPDIEQLKDLGSVHLVVLSACQTALADRRSNGIEIANVSYSFLQTGVKAVIASLWQVNDSSTSLLMQQFYKNLATGKLTKAEALRQAQLSLLQRKVTAEDAVNRATLIPKVNPQPRQNLNADFSHPYYWAPFILIGNSL